MKLSEFLKTIQEEVGEGDYDIQIVDMGGKLASIWEKFIIKKAYVSSVSPEDALDETKATPIITIEISEKDRKKLKTI